VDILLRTFAPKGALILDPFVGVGTTLIEAARQDLPAVGIEINPAAVEMATTCAFVALPLHAREKAIEEVRSVLDNVMSDLMPLFGRRQKPTAEPVAALLGLIQKERTQSLRRSILTNTLIRVLELPAPHDGEAAARAFDQHSQVIRALPQSSTPCRVAHADARCLPLEASSVDMVITSPPYINVFNYHQNNRTAMQHLGWDLLAVAQSEFGSNRKHRGNRFLTVIQYCLDMFGALQELRRVLKKKGRVIMVVGRESSVRGVSVRNGEIVAALGQLAGFDLALRQERRFTNKFGEMIVEDILHFEPTLAYQTVTDMSVASELAHSILTEAFEHAQDRGVRTDLADAVAMTSRVTPSPLFMPENCHAL
jgi:hypothetical protein